MFRETTEKRLRDAGWNLGRRVDISKYTHLYTSAGFEVFSYLSDFLQEFADLRFDFTTDQGIPIKFDFNIEGVLRDIESFDRKPEDFNFIVSMKSAPVGMHLNEIYWAVIGEDGSFWSVDTISRMKLGDNLAEAIEDL